MHLSFFTRRKIGEQHGEVIIKFFPVKHSLSLLKYIHLQIFSNIKQIYALNSNKFDAANEFSSSFSVVSSKL